MDDWSNKMGPVLVRLPDAPEGVWINLPEPKSMPAFKKKHMQNAIRWVLLWSPYCATATALLISLLPHPNPITFVSHLLQSMQMAKLTSPAWWLCCSWLNHTDTKELPYVKFSKPPRDANNPEIPHPHRIIGPQTWTHRRRVRQYRGQAPPIKVELSRTALPLRLAWALTVHRSQVGLGSRPLQAAGTASAWLLHCLVASMLGRTCNNVTAATIATVLLDLGLLHDLCLTCRV